MQKIFKAWLYFILVFAIFTSFLVGVESTFFGLVLMPLIVVVTIIIILGYMKK